MLEFSSGWERYDPPSPQFAYNSPSLVSAHAHVPALTTLTKEKAAGIYTIPHAGRLPLHLHTHRFVSQMLELACDVQTGVNLSGLLIQSFPCKFAHY